MGMRHSRHGDIFQNLFVLELANNHWGSVDRGVKIIRDHAAVVRHNNVKAAIKLQFRDADGFIHPEFKGNKEIRYIKKTEATKLLREGFLRLIEEIKRCSCIPMATPFDEKSVDLCVEFGLPIIKVASSDANDWPLLERIAQTRLPVIASSGGASEKDLDDMVAFFENRNIPLAINHCVSLYPSEDHELELDQIDYLKRRYPGHVIGFSTHEYASWDASMYISYAKGARTWERHIDIDHEGVAVSPYCSLPEHIDAWFRAYHKAREMSGSTSEQRRVVQKKEIEYLDALVRGIYARNDIFSGYVFLHEKFNKDFFLAIPLHKGQLSCREVINGARLVKDIKANEPLTIGHINGPYAESPHLKALIENRGIDWNGEPRVSPVPMEAMRRRP
jgi:N-acetylneuraminate synthase